MVCASRGSLVAGAKAWLDGVAAHPRAGVPQIRRTLRNYLERRLIGHAPPPAAAPGVSRSRDVLPASGSTENADIPDMTTGVRLPASFAFLAHDANAAIDAALLEAFAHLDPAIQRAALSVLIDRGNVAAQIKLLSLPICADGPVRSLLAERIDQLPQAVRRAVTSGSRAERVQAIDLIVLGGGAKLAYVLADALTQRDAKTRGRAAWALSALVRGWQDAPAKTTLPLAASTSDEVAAHLAEATSSAIQSWDFHQEIQVLDAAMRLADYCFDAVVQKLQQPKTTLAIAVEQRLARKVGACDASFVIRSLSVDRMRDSAAGCIGHADDPAFLRGLVREVWLLNDPAIRQGCRRIRNDKWLALCESELLRLNATESSALVELVVASGERPERKLECLRNWMDGGDTGMLNAVLWQLVADRSEGATALLENLRRRLDPRGAAVAKREIAARRGPLRPPAPPTNENRSPVHECMELCWRGFDRGSKQQRASLLDAVPREHGFVLSFVRGKLTATDERDRLRALQLSVALGLVVAFKDQIYRLAQDADPIVRSFAVGQLAQVPGTTCLRILRAATDDRDPRVVANAIEVLDALDAPARAAVTRPKLESKHARVRANAIKSLLRLDAPDAGEALLNMLTDKSQANRCSALWVVQRLQLVSLMQRIEHIALHDPSERVRQRAGRVLDDCSADVRRPVGSTSRARESTSEGSA